MTIESEKEADVLITDAEVVVDMKDDVVTDVIYTETPISHSQFGALYGPHGKPRDSKKKRIYVLFALLLLVICTIVLSVYLARSRKEVNVLSNQLGINGDGPATAYPPIDIASVSIETTNGPTTSGPTLSPSKSPMAHLTISPTALSAPLYRVTYREVSSGTCETQGYHPIREDSECANAIRLMGHLDTYAPPFSFYRVDVVDGCSLRLSDGRKFLQPAGWCEEEDQPSVFSDMMDTVEELSNSIFSWAFGDDDGNDDDYGDGFSSAERCVCSLDHPCFCREEP